MVQVNDSKAYYASAPTLARLKRRKRAEFRLRAYGVAAISLAALALVALMWSVVSKASGALTESYITLPVALEADAIDPENTNDYKVILRANFASVTKSTLREQFPTVKGRQNKRDLNDIVSSGAAFELAETVAQDPGLIGSVLDYRFLASDLTDLYLKGSYGALVAQETTGAVTLEFDGKNVLINSTEPDFTPVLRDVKQVLIEHAAKLRAQAALQDNGARVFTERAEQAKDDTLRASHLEEVAIRSAARDSLLAEAAALIVRASNGDGLESLGEDNKSVLLRVSGGWIKLLKVSANRATGEVLLPLQGDVTASTEWRLFITELPETSRNVSDNQIVWIETLKDQGRVDRVFNFRFFTAGDSREPELAGIRGAVVGTFLTMLVTFSLAFPIGVSTAIYLEEFAPRNRITDLIEVNINNLAAVPSIVFGLLGLAVFLTIFGVPRSAPLAGGIVLALMTLPTIIIAARAAIRAVPPSIRDAALGIGASKMQTSFHHVLPLAMPGILTGTIIGMAQALGETAPLILIGMVAFIVDIPTGVTDSATVLPVQIFRWSDFPERAFEARTAAAICVLLVFLVCMNALAIVLRKKFEVRW